MSSPQSASPDSNFQNRLNRVAERRAPMDANRPQIDVLPDWKANIRKPASLAIAFVLGIVAVFVVRIASYHITGSALIGESPDMVMVVETLASLVLAGVAVTLMRLKGFQYHLLHFAGVVLKISTMHNMVHSSPGLFGLVFSSEWTADVTARTEPGSFYLRGESLPFGGRPTVEEEDAKPALPTVRRMN